MKRITVICDRCLKECEAETAITLINVLHDDYDDDFRRDLCKDCYDEFNKGFMMEAKAKYMTDDPQDQPCPQMPKGEQDDETSGI